MAANPLNAFLAAATADTIRCTNQFEIELNTGDDELNSIIADKKVVLFGQNLAIPSRSIQYADVSFKGYSMTNLVPTAITMDQEHNMTVIDDVSGLHRRVFLAWMNKVINADIHAGSLFEGDRGVNESSFLRLKLFAKDNNTVSEVYEFFNVVVKSVGQTTVDYNGGDTSKFDVTFGSTYWRVLTQNGQIDNQRLANQV